MHEVEKVKIKKRYIKSDIVCDMLLKLLQNIRLTREQAIQRYEISSITFYKYIQAIRNMLVEFNHYEYELTYKKGYYQIEKYP